MNPKPLTYPQKQYKNAPYFYHSDHASTLLSTGLGSSSFITDLSGSAVQHLQYMPLRQTQGKPFGETFVNQTSTSWDARYKFTGKEKDGETGYSYFGARYYDSDISIWLSVDPMASKYPNMSPYAYVNNNPIMFIDRWGLEGEPKNNKDEVYKCNSCSSESSENLGYFKRNNNYNNNYTLNTTNSFMRVVNQHRFLETSPFLNHSENNNIGDKQNTQLNGSSGWHIDPVSAGLFSAGGLIFTVQNKVNIINRSFSFLQAESKSLGLGLDYSAEIMKIGNTVKLLRFTGYFVGLTAISLDAYKTFGSNPTMSYGKFSINATLTIVGYIGIPGAIVSGIYFGVDTFVPGGWGTISKNQYDMYNLHIQNGVMMAPWLTGK